MANGEVHGPFGLQKMRAWYQHGFFEDDLDVSFGSRNAFRKLPNYTDITSVGKLPRSTPAQTPAKAQPSYESGGGTGAGSGAVAADVRVNRHGSISIGSGAAAQSSGKGSSSTPMRSSAPQPSAAATAWTPQPSSSSQRTAESGQRQAQAPTQAQQAQASGGRDPGEMHYYSVAGTEYGPFSQRQLQAWATAGYFNEDYATRPAAYDGAPSVLSRIVTLPKAVAAGDGDGGGDDRGSAERPGMPQVVSAFEAAIESLGPNPGVGESTALVASGRESDAMSLVNSPSYGHLRQLSEQVRTSQAVLSTHCEALESGLLEKIQTLEANQRRQELIIASKARECEELRADNERLQLYVRLTTNQAQASSAAAYGAQAPSGHSALAR
jgi:hypothetical protein